MALPTLLKYPAFPPFSSDTGGVYRLRCYDVRHVLIAAGDEIISRVN